MAAAVKTFIALCALLVGISADKHCTTETLGDVSGTPHPLDPLPLPPPVKTWDIKTNADSVCSPNRPVGLIVKACDPDGPPPPSVDILSLNEVIVTRHTEAYTSATVYITVYCEEAWGEVGGVGGVGVDRGVGGVVGVRRVGGVGGVRGIGGVGVRGRVVPTAVPLI